VLQSEGLTVARRGAGVFVRDSVRFARRAVEPPTRAAAPVRPVDRPAAPRRTPVDGCGGRVVPPRLAGALSTLRTDDGGRAWPSIGRGPPDAATPVVAGALAVPAGTGRVGAQPPDADARQAAMLAVVRACRPRRGHADQPTGRRAGRRPRPPREFGHPPVRLVEELRARMPLRQEAAELQLPAGPAVIVLCRTASTATGRPVEFTKGDPDADAYVWSTAFPCDL